MIDRINVLDHGYIQYIEHWGSDQRIIEAARMSTGKGFLGWGPIITMVRQCVRCCIIEDEPFAEGTCLETDNGKHQWGEADIKREKPGDEKLLRFLYENKHTTPFEMGGLTIEVEAPIAVFREWHRHRTQSYNEMSARYTPLPDVNYLPSTERLLIGGDGKNRQAGTIKGSDILDLNSALAWQSSLADVYEQCERVYQDGLRRGVPKELARLCVPVGRYSRMRASANLLNWLRFLTLRMDTKAQWEIRQYANGVGTMIAQTFPRTWDLFSGTLKI